MAHCIVSEAEAILDKEFPVLDKGFVRLVDYMGGDVNIFMRDFSNYLDSKSSTEYKEMIYSKGYPITKIYYSKD